MNRRDFLLLSAAGGGALMLGACRRGAPETPRTQARPGPSPYGPLSDAPDANGLRLPAGFTSRLLARTGEEVPGTSYRWHPAPDGGACFPSEDGGWVYVSNSEASPGGAGALRFDAGGARVGAWSILSGTSLNCAGGPTPWGTWLSCEEFDGGRVWECNPFQPSQGVVRPALGTFAHEAVAVDPGGRCLYLTEDRPDGRLYRFTPAAWPSLEEGRLEAARFSGEPLEGVDVTWVEVSREAPASRQPAARHTAAFNGGEGCWYDGGRVYFTTKGDNRVWTYDVARARLEVLYDASLFPGSPLSGVDNVVLSRAGELYVAEDGGDMQVCLVTPERLVAPLLQLVGHDGSELCGPAFSPDGRRLYFSSQRGPHGAGPGVTFEVTGPFR